MTAVVSYLGAPSSTRQHVQRICSCSVLAFSRSPVLPQSRESGRDARALSPGIVVGEQDEASFEIDRHAEHD